MTMTLKVSPRTANGAAALRAAGQVPGVVYGPKHKAESVAIDRVAFEKLFKEAGESTIITLDGLTEPIEVLVQEVDFDPTKGGVRHVDFYAIERGKEMTTQIPLEFVGEAPVEKSGATINKVLYEVTVTCRPSALPKHIEVDVSNIANEEDQITVAEVVVPEGVTIDNDPTDVVVTVSAARDVAAEEAENAEAPDMEAVVATDEKGEEEAAT